MLKIYLLVLLFTVQMYCMNDRSLNILHDTERLFIIKSKLPDYTTDNIDKKIEEYAWPREKVLLFLLLNKLQNWKYNEIFNYAMYHNITSSYEPDFKKYTLKMNRAFENLRQISRNAYECNNWDYTENPAYETVSKIETSLFEYVKNNEMQKLFDQCKVPLFPKEDDHVLHNLSNCSFNGWTKLEKNLLLSKDTKLSTKLRNFYFLKNFHDDLDTKKIYY